MRNKLSKNQSIVSTMFQDLKPSVRNTNSKDNIIYDIIPFCLPIITPTLRPVISIFINYVESYGNYLWFPCLIHKVSAQLYSAEEKEQIQRVMNIMISYNLTFRQEKTIDGVYRYCLEPYDWSTTLKKISFLLKICLFLLF